MPPKRSANSNTNITEDFSTKKHKMMTEGLLGSVTNEYAKLTMLAVALIYNRNDPTEAMVELFHLIDDPMRLPKHLETQEQILPEARAAFAFLTEDFHDDPEDGELCETSIESYNTFSRCLDEINTIPANGEETPATLDITNQALMSMKRKSQWAGIILLELRIDNYSFKRSFDQHLIQYLYKKYQKKYVSFILNRRQTSSSEESNHKTYENDIEQLRARLLFCELPSYITGYTCLINDLGFNDASFIRYFASSTADHDTTTNILISTMSIDVEEFLVGIGFNVEIIQMIMEHTLTANNLGTMSKLVSDNNGSTKDQPNFCVTYIRRLLSREIFTECVALMITCCPNENDEHKEGERKDNLNEGEQKGFMKDLLRARLEQGMNDKRRRSESSNNNRRRSLIQDIKSHITTDDYSAINLLNELITEIGYAHLLPQNHAQWFSHLWHTEEDEMTSRESVMEMRPSTPFHHDGSF